MNKEEWLNSVSPLCEICREPKSDVRTRVDPYLVEIGGCSAEYAKRLLCAVCVRQRAMDI
jgi:hypothetical protein